jgi:hypothetical protein
MTPAARKALFSEGVRRAYRNAMRRKKAKHPKPSKENRDLAEIKELLGPLAARYTDAQLDRLSHEMAVGASLLLGLYLQQKGDRPGPRAIFDSDEDKR